MLCKLLILPFVSVYFVLSVAYGESTEETKISSWLRERLKYQHQNKVNPKSNSDEEKIKEIKGANKDKISIYSVVENKSEQDFATLPVTKERGIQGGKIPSELSKFLEKLLNKIKLKSDPDPETTEYGEHFEGDMIIEEKFARSNILRTNYWPDGVIPFDFDKNFPQEDRKRVLNVISFLNHKTCLRFRKHWYFLDGPTYVIITNKKPGCFATVGRPSKGRGNVNLAKSCMQKDGIIIHELLHSVGIFHEHSRYDRDNYVKIHWENIQPRDIHNFQMRNNFQVFEIPYDYYSIMHYSTHAYTRNGLPTLEPKKNVDLRMMGQRDFLTNSDLEKVKRIYCH